jgi:hypothetical protein
MTLNAIQKCNGILNNVASLYDFFHSYTQLTELAKLNHCLLNDPCWAKFQSYKSVITFSANGFRKKNHFSLYVEVAILAIDHSGLHNR